MIDFLTEAEDLFPYTQRMRRDFHMHPEMGFQEFRTSGIVAKELGNLGIPVTTGVAETGVVGLIEGDAAGKITMLRFDMDALPVNEETGAEYASKERGVMHACGHDGHTAIGLSVAKLLMKHKNLLGGTIKLVFQPAEEGLGGAERMISEGVLVNPKPDNALGLHIWNGLPLGSIVVTSGAFMAGADMFSIKVMGQGSHGAAPHLGRDPITAASQIVNGLNSITSRNVDPFETAVVSVTAIQGGATFNVIPPLVEIKGTIRSFRPAVRERVLERMGEIIQGTAAAMACEVEFEIVDLTPPVVNDADLSSLVRQQAISILPETEVIDGWRTMVSEDMALLMADVPGCYFFVGSKNEKKGLVFGHHHPKFDFDERALVYGVALISAAAIELNQNDDRK